LEQIKAAMVQVFVTTELLSDESRAATSDEAAARRDETLARKFSIWQADGGVGKSDSQQPVALGLGRLW
jgi:hypothetical protein